MSDPYRTPAAAPDERIEVGPLEADLEPSGKRTGPPLHNILVAAIAMTTLLALVGAAAYAGTPSGHVAASLVFLVPLAGVLIERRVLRPAVLRDFNARLNPLLAVLARGKLDEAEAGFRDLLRRTRGRPGLQAISLFNIAAVRTRRGDLTGALRILVALSSYVGTPKAQLDLKVKLNLALKWAQLGDTDAAAKWLTAARASKQLMYVANVEALILTRQGRYADAEAAYVREWPDLERLIGASEMRAIAARRAFALEAAGADASQVERYLGKARSDDRRELVHLGVAWPEMHAFLERHDLIDRYSGAAG
jgi:hypothetical protein